MAQLTINIPALPKAGRTLTAMKKLLNERRCGVVGRVAFLKRWGRLREKLYRTQEYQDFRLAVITRANGKCEEGRCKRLGAHVHHKIPVARCVDLALNTLNAKYLCLEHHGKNHPNVAKVWMRKSK
jgi:hypothetical protein